MRRVVAWAAVGAGVLVAVRKLKQAGSVDGHALAERMSAHCERMLASMPASFPPNRMMADLETVKIQTARILEVLDEEVLETYRPKEVLRQ